MASPQLAIARVSFSAVLLRADPTSCSRGEIDEFLGQLDATVSRCSPPNVQKCKQWILQNLARSSSPARSAALTKYLTALANSYSADVAASRRAREPSSKRKRLHILYILHDVLYHVQVRDRDPVFAAKLEPAIPDLVQSAAAFSNCPKHTKKVQDLVNIWEDNRQFSPDFIGKLRTTVQEAPNTQLDASKANGATDGAKSTASKSSKDAPFVMPAMHGDATVPWYDLPAANWLPVIEPNSTRPMAPDMIKPLQFAAGPADKRLIKAVKDLLADVDRLYAKGYSSGGDAIEDIDQLGQRIVLDEITGDVIGGETYYGWSRAFCEKMKQRRKKGGSISDERGRSMSRTRSRSSSPGSPRPALKRRRMSSSRSRSRSRSRSQDYRRSYSRERRRQRSYSSSRSSRSSRSRTPSPARKGRRYNHSRSQSRSRGRSPPPQPRPFDTTTTDYGGGNNTGGKQPPPNFPPQGPPHPPPFQQSNFAPHSFPTPSGNFNNQFPVPPPPPPNYHGQWPPPPPPPPPHMGGMPQNWFSGVPAMGGGWAAPPPPTPPVQSPYQHPQQQGGGGLQYGRGGRGDYRGQGYRGGWNRGRGWQ